MLVVVMINPDNYCIVRWAVRRNHVPLYCVAYHDTSLAQFVQRGDGEIIETGLKSGVAQARALTLNGEEA